MVCGPVGLGASPKVRPTSVDHPSESEYLSEAVFIFDCFKDSRIFRLRLPFFLPGVFAAMGLKASLGVDVFNDFASSGIVHGMKPWVRVLINHVRLTVFWFVNGVTLLNKRFNQRWSSVGGVGMVHDDMLCLAGFREVKNFLMTCMR